MISLQCISLVLCLSYALLMSLCPISSAADDDKKAYIVYMGSLPSKSDYSPMSHHHSILQEVVSSVGDSMIRSYGRSFNGFAARLSETEREKIAAMEGIVSIFPSEVYQLHTTRSYDFMGLNDGIKHNPEFETDTVIGAIDTGIWPESRSFSDEGLTSLPRKWKGSCNGGFNFTCNKKVIGARYYVGRSARDEIGHGTHTASTAVGNRVRDVSYYGLARGTARGGVPTARIAVYRICERQGCNGEAILAAFDEAIADGVDVITISIGGGPAPFYQDSLAIGAFHAMAKGILTVASAGNEGPSFWTVMNLSPWILTVAASSTDRKFITKVVTGDGKTLLGTSINSFDLKGKKYPLAYGKTTSSSCAEEEARSCESGCFDKVKGKIVVCDYVTSFSELQSLGAVGVIFHLVTDSTDIGILPISVLADDEYEALRSYITSTENPKGTILKSETIKDSKAPVVVSFSSRGPNALLNDILKPDITAPGVNILAAYSPLAPITSDPNDERRVDYHILSGTSMSCPHVAGVAAYVKSIRPDWSPSAIRSALMTTALPMNASDNEGAEFAYGSGHIDPTKATDPGLVYDATHEDYLKMLCALNYTAKALEILSHKSFNCPQGSNLVPRDLNYPSMAAKVSPSSSSSSKMTFSRTVTNVGTASSVYKAQVMTSDPRFSVRVKPQTLCFKSLGEKKSFVVTVSSDKDVASTKSGFVSASLVWSDGSHVVRSPIVVYS